MPSIPRPIIMEYHQQEEASYCGAACAQMVLQSLGIGLNDVDVAQDALFNRNNGSQIDTVDWGMAPGELGWTLRSLSPARRLQFNYVAASNEEFITRLIIWTLFKGRAAPLAACYAGGHWVVVVDYKVSKQPEGPSDTSYTIEEILVKDPAPPLIFDQDPPPHHNTDGCGTGSESARGHILHHVHYDEWQRCYMTAVDKGKLKGHFVAVCEMDPTENLPPQVSPASLQDLQLIAQPVPDIQGAQDMAYVRGKPQGDPPAPEYDRCVEPERPSTKLIYTLLTHEEAQQKVREQLGEFELLTKDPWNYLLDGAEPGLPVKVERLDHAGEVYYILPMVRPAGDGAPVAVIIDAHTGKYKQAAAVPERNMTALSAALYDPTASFAWAPSVESFSPFYPFVRSTDPDRPGFSKLGDPYTRFLEPTRDVLGF
jgi:hypothetical protein